MKSLFGLFANKSQPVLQVGQRRFGPASDQQGDCACTEQLRALFAIPHDVRDHAWNERFWDAVWRAALQVTDPPVFTAADGRLYLRLDVPKTDAADTHSLANIAASMVEQGVGVAVFASPDQPPIDAEYAASMGVLDSILRFDDPNGEPSEIAEGRQPIDRLHIDIARSDHAEIVTLKMEQAVLTAAPSKEYLSKAAARALQRHLINGWGLADPHVSLMTIPALRPARSLVIGKSHAQFVAEGVPEELITLRAKMLSWYFPPSRALVLMPDDWNVERMTPLAELV